MRLETELRGCGVAGVRSDEEPVVHRRAGAQWWAVGRARRAVGGLLRAVRQVVGAPDYARYLEHHAARHPGREPLSPREYYADFLTWRFGSGSPTRCC
jgi:uncharacterized short protein YbdD (DUF466 family)